MIELTAEFQRGYEQIIRQLALISTGMELNRAIYRAAQRAAQAGVTIIKKEISAETTLKQSTVAKTVKKYVQGNPAGEFAIGVRISDTARPLSEFKFLPKMPKPHTAPIVEIYRGKKQTLSNGAFVQQMPSGHIGIFQRLGEKRLPIKELRGPAVTGIFKANEEIHNSAFEKIYEVLEKRVVHELNWILENKK